MKEYYDFDDRSANAQEFRRVSNLVQLEAEQAGIRAALDKYKRLYPHLALALETEAEEIFELAFLSDDADRTEEDEELSDAARWAMLEALGRARGFHLHTGAKFVWDGNCWIDALENGHGTLQIAIGFYEDC